LTATTDFITELFRAANEIDKLGTLEKGRLLQRAIVTIRHMRDVVGIPTRGTEADVLIEIGTVAASIDRRPNEDARMALLNAAGMIRDLRIVMDSKIEVIVKAARET
jgi:hypothetical protein